MTASGQKIANEEFISFMLDVLGPEFDALKESIQSKLDSLSESISISEVKYTLQNFEQRLKWGILIMFWRCKRVLVM